VHSDAWHILLTLKGVVDAHVSSMQCVLQRLHAAVCNCTSLIRVVMHQVISLS
jgi:hypothetical protein